MVEIKGKEEAMNAMIKFVTWAVALFLVYSPVDAWAALCTGTLEEKVDCLNEKLKYVEIDTDAGGKPLEADGKQIQVKNW